MGDKDRRVGDDLPRAARDRERERVTGAFFFQAEDGIRDLTVTGVQTCALPISGLAENGVRPRQSSPIHRWPHSSSRAPQTAFLRDGIRRFGQRAHHQTHKESVHREFPFRQSNRKSTRLNSSHSQISYAVFCLKKKKKL